MSLVTSNCWWMFLLCSLSGASLKYPFHSSSSSHTCIYVVLILGPQYQLFLWHPYHCCSTPICNVDTVKIAIFWVVLWLYCYKHEVIEETWIKWERREFGEDTVDYLIVGYNFASGLLGKFFSCCDREPDEHWK